MFGKLRRNAPKTTAVDVAMTAAPTASAAQRARPEYTPITSSPNTVRPSAIVPSMVGTNTITAPSLAQVGSIAAQVAAKHGLPPVLPARTHTKAHPALRASKSLVARVRSQRPAWTNRLPTEVTTQVTRAEAVRGAKAPGTPPAQTRTAPTPTYQPEAIPTVTKGGSSWAFIGPR